MAKRAKNQAVDAPAILFQARNWILPALGIALAIAWIYGPVRHGDWLWDDNLDITQNKITQSPGGIWNIWFQPGSQLDYYPLKATAQWLQWRIFQGDTLGYHLTNIVLHYAAALLVWRLFLQLGLRHAWLGGLLFAIHPAQVESVAWIAELKNTLSTPFFLLSICFYLDYDAKRWRRDYVAAVAFFLLAMLAKTTVAMFPVVILLYAWWKRGRVEAGDVRASAPFFLISLVLGGVTLQVGGWYEQLHHVTYQAQHLGVLSHLALTSSSIAFYFGKAIWPMGLLPIYPQWSVSPPTLFEFAPWPVMAGLFVWFWKNRAGWGRHALLGAGFFLIMLAPFVCVVVPGYMDFTWVMDHFLYVPIIGLIGLVVAGVGKLDALASPGFRVAGWVAMAVIVALLTQKSRSYAKRFLSPEALWSYTLRHNPAAWPAHNNLGNVDYSKGRLDAALADYEAVLKLNPRYLAAECDIGHIKQISGDLNGALAAYNEALAESPTDGEAYYSRALVRQALQDWDGSLSDLLAAQYLCVDSTYVDYTHLLTWRVRIAQNRPAQADQELADAMAKGWNSPLADWITKVARFLLGQTDEATFLADTGAPVAMQDAEQRCEAWYFAGLKRLAGGDRGTAAIYFQNCLDTQERASAEYMLAQAELKALRSKP